MFSKSPVLMRVFFFILLPLICVFIYLFHEATKSVPNKIGQVYIEGLHDKVVIHRDSHSVPTISSNYESDMYFAMGYLHAQDRLWQLELQRRIGRGELSEILGKTALSNDVWLRTLGLRGAAEKSLPYLSKDAHNALTAYVSGINSWINSKPNLPIEFKLFDIEPKSWDVVDSLTWNKVFSLNLSGNMNEELSRLIALSYIDTKSLELFFPYYDSDLLPSNKNSASKDQLISLLKSKVSMNESLIIGAKNTGSNAWVISGQHTDSGYPILANDPHLGLQIPSLWYAVKQQYPGFEAMGMTLVGSPLIIFGQNTHIAWGGTNMMADVQDLKSETLHPNNKNLYLHNGEWKQLQVENLSINVKADFPSELRAPIKPVHIQVRKTLNGPMIDTSGSNNLSLKWVSLDDDDTTFEAIYRINRAINWQQFKEAASLFVAPALNLVYADKYNNIGYKAAGRIPLRSTLAEQENDEKYIPFSELPEIYNPNSGFIATANNKNTDDDYKYIISNDFANPARVNRIQELILNYTKNDKKISNSNVMDMQSDIVDLSANNLVNFMRKVEGRTSKEKEVLDKINDWNLSAGKESVGATIYYVWLYYLKDAIFSDELSGYWNYKEEGKTMTSLKYSVFPQVIAKMIQDQHPWCDDVATQMKETCEDMLVVSLNSAILNIDKMLGKDVEDWQYKNLSKMVYEHVPFSNVNLVSNFFERNMPASGSENTIKVASGYYDSVEGYISKLGAGFKQIISFGEVSKHYYINSTGQSGIVFDDYYDDMLSIFNEGGYLNFNVKDEKYKLVMLPK